MSGTDLTDEEVDAFVRGTLAESALARAEEHLLVCEDCRLRVEQLEQFVASLRTAISGCKPPLEIVHITQDGPIRLQTRLLEDGRWRAELTGAETQSVGTFATHEQASLHVLQVFNEMFPEHVCDAGCSGGVRRIA